MVLDVKQTTNALSGLKPQVPLCLEGNLAINWKGWFKAFKIYAIASGIAGKLDHMQGSAEVT